MKDTIYRQAAIDAVHNEFDDCIVWDESGMTTANEVERILDSVPSAQPDQRWIPVSERLPEEDACYLVTTSGTNNDIIDIAYYTEGIWHKTSRIKAWMPLPKPYKDGKQDD